jgi:anti-sigma regulatory factor (Ser/Thr protein kinase)
MTPHASFAVHEASQVGAVRRHAARLAAEAAFDEVAAGRLALVVNELGNNLLRHAKEGRLLVARLRLGDADWVEVISLDRGPGMRDLQRCLEDGYSTGGTSGTGLGAVRRLAGQFDAFSEWGQGTVIVARLAPRGELRAAPTGHDGVQIAGVCTAAPGETVSGDSWEASASRGEGRVILADGLGHGPEAARAADAAVEVFRQHPAAAAPVLFERMHARLRTTRGAAVAVLAFDAAADTLWLAGAGNVVGRVISGVADRSLVAQHGTVGLQMRSVQPMSAAWDAHALLVLHSDGIASRWTLAATPGLMQASAIVVAAWILHQHLRGRDDATVVVVRR